jgi:hypothetical protein
MLRTGCALHNTVCPWQCVAKNVRSIRGEPRPLRGGKQGVCGYVLFNGAISYDGYIASGTDKFVWNIGGMITTEETVVLGQKPVLMSQCHLSTTNPTWTYRVTVCF